MSLNHLMTEQRFWRPIVEDLCRPGKLLTDVQVNLMDKTVTCKIVHPTHSPYINKSPELVSRINVDRAKRPEAEIRAEIEKIVKEKEAIG